MNKLLLKEQFVYIGVPCYIYECADGSYYWDFPLQSIGLFIGNVIRCYGHGKTQQEAKERCTTRVRKLRQTLNDQGHVS